MKAYLILLMQPVYERRQQGSLWLTWTLLVMASVLLLLAALDSGTWSAYKTAGAVLFAALGLMWWSLYVQSAVRQHAPGMALVPSWHQRLMLLTVVLWLAGSLVLALPFFLATGHFGYPLAGISAVMLFVVAAQRLAWLPWVPAFAFVGATLLVQDPVGRAVRSVGSLDELWFALGCLVACGIAARWVLRLVFAVDGDARYEWHAAWARKQALVRRGEWTIADSGRFAWLDRLPLAYASSLARACRAHAHRQGAGLLMYGLGPRVYHGTYLRLVLGYFLGLMLFAAWCRYRGTGLAAFVSTAYFQFLAMLPAATMVPSMLGALRRSAGEQALLRLAPAAPAAAALNQLLARALLRRFLAVWATSALVAMAAGAALPGLAPLAGTELAMAIAAFVLPLACILLRDYATLAVSARVDIINGLLVGVVAMMASLLHTFGSVVPGLWAWSAGLTMGVSLLALVWRWRRMLAAPVAFPTGRNA